MADIYGKTTTPKTTKFVTCDTMKLKIGTKNDAQEFLVQNLSIQYNQALNRVYEIGSANTYFAPGRTMGALQIGRIIGSKTIEDVLGKAGKGMWNPNDEEAEPSDRELLFYNPNDTEGKPLFKVKGAIVESYAMQTQAQGLLIYENVSMQFSSLEFEN